MKKIVLLIAGVSMLAIACNNSEDNGATTDMPVTETENVMEGIPANSTEGEGASALNQAITDGGNVPATATAAASGQAVNPPHGEPGHDCGLAVGAPMNGAAKPSAAAPKAEVKVESPQNINPPAVQVAPAATAPGMNPPHGEPGHDCAVAVGAPLNK